MSTGHQDNQDDDGGEDDVGDEEDGVEENITLPGIFHIYTWMTRFSLSRGAATYEDNNDVHSDD